MISETNFCTLQANKFIHILFTQLLTSIQYDDNNNNVEKYKRNIIKIRVVVERLMAKCCGMPLTDSQSNVQKF